MLNKTEYRRRKERRDKSILDEYNSMLEAGVPKSSIYDYLAKKNKLTLRTIYNIIFKNKSI